MKTPLRWAMGMGLALVSGLTGLGNRAAAASSETSPAITIHMHNYARVAPKTLAEAEDVVTTIFREAGLDTRWAETDLAAVNDQENFAGHSTYSPADIQVSILPKEMSDRLGFPNNVMGEVPGTEAQIAYVFNGKVETLFHTMLSAYTTGRIDRRASESQILGHAIAHELGHLLLNLQGHSARGIMRGEWVLQTCEMLQIGCCYSRRSRRKSSGQTYGGGTLIKKHSMSPSLNPRHRRAKGIRKPVETIQSGKAQLARSVLCTPPQPSSS